MATSIVDEIHAYAGQHWCERLDFRLLDTMAHDGWKRLNGFDQRIEEVVSFPNRKCFAVAGGTHVIRIYDAVEGQLLREIHVGEDSHIEALAISPDESLIAIGESRDYRFFWWPTNSDTVSILELDGLKLRKRLSGFRATIDSLAFLRDSQALAVGTRYEPIEIFPLDSDRPSLSFPSQRRNEDLFASSSDELTWISKSLAVTRQMISGEPRSSSTVELDLDQSVLGGAFKRIGVSADGRWVATTMQSSNDAMLWDMSKEPRQAMMLENPHGVLRSIRVSPEGKCVAAGTMGGGVVGWDITPEHEGGGEVEPRKLVKIRAQGHRVFHDAPVYALSVDDAGNHISGSDDGAVVMSNRDGTGTARRQHRIGDGSFALDMTSDGHFAIVGTTDGSVWRLDMRSQVSRKIIDLGDVWVSQVVISDDDTLVAVGDTDGRIVMADMSGILAADTTATLSGHWTELPKPDFPTLTGAMAWELHFSKDNSELVACFGKAFLQWIDLKSFKTLRTFHVPTSMDAICLVNPTTVLSMGDSVYHINVDSSKIPESEKGVRDVRCLCHDLGNAKVHVGCIDGRVRTLDLDGNVLASSRSWNSLSTATLKTRSITAIECSRDGRILFTGSDVGDVAMWDAETLRLLGTIWESDGTQEIKRICVSDDGQTILMFQRALVYPAGISSGVARWIRLNDK